MKPSKKIRITNTGEEFDCSDQQHILMGMTKLGRKGIPSGCHGGGCGVCKIQVLSGEVRTLPMSRTHVTEEEQRLGFALACRCYPLSDISLHVVGKMEKGVCGRKYGFV